MWLYGSQSSLMTTFQVSRFDSDTVTVKEDEGDDWISESSLDTLRMADILLGLHNLSFSLWLFEYEVVGL